MVKCSHAIFKNTLLINEQNKSETVFKSICTPIKYVQWMCLHRLTPFPILNAFYQTKRSHPTEYNILNSAGDRKVRKNFDPI